MANVAVRKTDAVARPLKVLVPMIRQELDAGERAGIEHYRRAGEMLVEAKDQMPYGNWGRWLAKNFKAADGTPLSQKTASRYMRLAELVKTNPSLDTRVQTDYSALIGDRRPRTQTHASFRKVVNATRELDAELFAQERQTRDDEVKLHRDLAIELIDIGYRALATRLHPDRGGSKDAMVRLNRVREELTTVAKTRRFV